MNLPKFKYHLDPIKSGSIEPSETTCVCCGKQNGYIYTGPVYSTEELEDSICPWCIADGSAHDKFDAEFTDFSGIGGYGDWDDVPNEIKEEISFRTPGFTGWQQEQWWTHCNDGAEFIEVGGKAEVLKYDTSLRDELKNNAHMSESDWNDYFDSMHKDNGPTAYIFRCKHCGKTGGYSDIH